MFQNAQNMDWGDESETQEHQELEGEERSNSASNSEESGGSSESYPPAEVSQDENQREEIEEVESENEEIMEEEIQQEIVTSNGMRFTFHRPAMTCQVHNIWYPIFYQCRSCGLLVTLAKIESHATENHCCCVWHYYQAKRQRD